MGGMDAAEGSDELLTLADGIDAWGQ